MKKTKCKFFLLFLFVLVLFFGCDNSSPRPNDNPTVGGGINGYEKIYSGLELMEYIPNRNASKIVITDSLVDLNDNPIRTYVNEYSINPAQKYVKHNLHYYGRHFLYVDYYVDGQKVSSTFNEVVKVADKYNVASIFATVPALYFTLMDIDNSVVYDFFDPHDPSIVALERREAYDWEQLPENMTTSPFVADAQFADSGYTAVDILFSNDGAYWKYIDYLYQLDNDSEFVVIANDFWQAPVFSIMEIGVPLDQIKFVLISDGTGTYADFRAKYGDGSSEIDNSMDVYNVSKSKWDEIKSGYINGKENFLDVLGDKNAFFYAHEFSTVLVNDSDIDAYWIVNRNNADTWGTSKVYTDLIENNERVISVNMGNLFSALTEEEKTSFKKLYSIDTETIDISNGKPLLVFLGTATENETNLEEYLTVMKGLLGDKYNCYYKGHPAHIYNGAEARSAILENLDIEALDPAIPAELFGFFYSDSVYAGYPSSTYSNVENDCVLLTFVGSKDGALANIQNYIGKVLNYIEKTDDGSFNIVKNYNTKNAQTASWNGKDDLSALEWTPFTEI